MMMRGWQIKFGAHVRRRRWVYAAAGASTLLLSIVFHLIWRSHPSSPWLFQTKLRIADTLLSTPLHEIGCDALVEGGELSAPILSNAIDSPNPDKSLSGLFALRRILSEGVDGRRAPQVNREALLDELNGSLKRCLKRDETAIRIAAINVIGSSKAAIARYHGDLRALSNDKDVYVSLKAAIVLWTNDRDYRVCLPAFKAALQQGDEKERAFALGWIETMEDAAAPLRSELESLSLSSSANYGIRWRAAKVALSLDRSSTNALVALVRLATLEDKSHSLPVKRFLRETVTRSEVTRGALNQLRGKFGEHENDLIVDVLAN